MNTKLYVGLDVHKDSIAVAIAKAGGSPPQSCGSWGGTNLSAERGLLRLRKKFGVSKEEISVAYEAGPTGFTLARRLEQLGYRCLVAAPSEIPQKPGERVKTDRIDARKIARLHRAGELEGIHVPGAADSRSEEVLSVATAFFREVVRMV